MTRGIIRKVMTGGRVTLLFVALAALPVSGCGATWPIPARPIAASRCASTIPRPARAHRGARRALTLVAHNGGRLTHNLGVVQFKRRWDRAGEEYGEPTKTLFPGESAQTTVDLEPGKYRLVCTIANHDNLGQYGELKVVR